MKHEVLKVNDHVQKEQRQDEMHRKGQTQRVQKAPVSGIHRLNRYIDVKKKHNE
jgi:hypothetical protein